MRALKAIHGPPPYQARDLKLHDCNCIELEIFYFKMEKIGREFKTRKYR